MCAGQSAHGQKWKPQSLMYEHVLPKIFLLVLFSDENCNV